jgi:hypothetical protein
VAVDPDEVDAIASTVADLYREAETALGRLVARYLAAGIDAPTWSADRMAAVGALRRAAGSIVTGLAADSGRAIAEATAAAYRTGWGSALADLPERWFARSGIGQAARAAADLVPGTAAVEALAAAVHRDIGDRSANVLREVLDAYRSTVTAATARVLTGVQTRRDAAQAAWQQLVDQGITGFTDTAGRRWRLSSYVEMATRTVAQRAAVTGQTDRLDTIGVRLVIVSNAPQECALCRPFEGKVLRLGSGPTGDTEQPHPLDPGRQVAVHVVATLDQARAAGLQHPNCRHSVSAYLPVITRRPTGTADPEGDAARQRQRALERQIRRWKEREQTAITDDARAAARRRVRGWQATLREHLDGHPDLKRLRYREQPGAGNTPPAGRHDPAGDIGPDMQTTLDGTAEPLRRRPRTDQPAPDAADQHPATKGQGNLEDVLPAGLSDDELDTAMADALGTGDMERFERLAAEADRRDAAREAAQARKAADRARRERARQAREERQYAELERLLDSGVAEEEAVAQALGISVERQRRDRAIQGLRQAGYTGRGLDEMARQSYRDHIARAYLQAEDFARGHVLTAEGDRLGINPISLFSGPETRARRYASPELREWWDMHGRPTFAEWKAQLLGDTGAVRGIRAAGRDFLT